MIAKIHGTGGKDISFFVPAGFQFAELKVCNLASGFEGLQFAELSLFPNLKSQYSVVLLAAI